MAYIYEKNDIPTIKLAAFIFTIYAGFAVFEYVLINYFDKKIQNAGLFSLINALTFGAIMFYSLDRIIKSMIQSLNRCEKKIEELENKLKETESS
ncbi:MAG: hypothetical protein NE327_12510 [Lentisphaeraceae bacterium]|nr:hypothetical protein [Lentisphaeraceae bacterium]